jgi:hypothetical protein
MICNITDASLHLGFRSRTTLQRLVAKGHLAAYLRPSDGREVLLETAPPGLPSLRETVQTATQYRPGSPLWRQERRRTVAELSDEELGARCDEVMAGLDAATTDWIAISETANWMLDCSAWGPPPWPADRWATLAMVISLAEEQAAA